MVEEVKRWETKFGTVHKTKQQAEAAERRTVRYNALHDILAVDTPVFVQVEADYDRLFEWLEMHWPDVKRAMEKL